LKFKNIYKINALPKPTCKIDTHFPPTVTEIDL
jgi:hypothetical protein